MQGVFYLLSLTYGFWVHLCTSTWPGFWLRIGMSARKLRNGAGNNDESPYGFWTLYVALGEIFMARIT
jgi:hypothetical protein